MRQHLQDHLCINYLFRSKVPTLNDKLSPLFGRLRYGLQYLLTRSDPLSLGINHAGGFVRSSPALTVPDMQLFFSPISYSKAPPGERPLMKPDPFSGFILAAQPTRPTSRDHLAIKSTDPTVAPSIHPNYLATDQDRQDIVAASKLVRALVEAPALSSIIIRKRSNRALRSHPMRKCWKIAASALEPCFTRSAPAAWGQIRSWTLWIPACECMA